MNRISRLWTLSILGCSVLVIGAVHTVSVGPSADLVQAFVPECSDTRDNDADGYTDFPGDAGCESSLDEDEGPGIYADRDPRNIRETTLPPLAISVADGKEFAEPGEILHYEIVVENPSGPDRVFDLRTIVPAELNLEAVTDNGIVDTRAILWPSQAIPAGGVRTYGIAARIESGTPDLQAVRLRAYIGQSMGSDTTSIYRGVVPAAFSLSVSDGTQVAAPGSELEYAIVIHNEDTKLATEVDVNAALPQYTEFVAASEGGSWTGKSIRWSGLTVSPKGDRLLNVRLRVRSDAPLGTVIQLVADMKGHQAVDATEIALEVSEPMPVSVENSSVVLRKTSDRSEVRPGEVISYTVYLRNTTGRNLTNVTVEDRMDRRYMEVIGGDAGTMQGDRIVWNIAELQANASWQVRYTVRVSEGAPHGSALLNIVSVSGEGIKDTSLTQRVNTAQISVVRKLPPAGVANDVLLTMMTLIGALVPTLALRKNFA